MEKILIFVEMKANQPRKASLELLSEGKALAGAGKFVVEAVVLGRLEEQARQAILPYVDTLVNIKDELLRSYTAEAYSLALATHAKEVLPKLILAGATRMGRDFMPRVAAILGSGIASDVTAANWRDEPMTFVRPIYGGRVLAQVSFAGYPAVVTTRPNTFSVTEQNGRAGEFVEKNVGLLPEQIKVKPLRIVEKAVGSTDLSEADIIISGGQGMKAAENFSLLEELAEVVGGAVGATRSAVDSKWREYEDQVGKSGKTVSPKLYVAVGISGAIHHIMGMGTSKVVVAVNKDSNAPIFKYADYGIVGDLFDVVPALTREFRKRMGK